MSRESAMPEVQPGEIRKHSLKDYLVRFAFGAAISLAAGLVESSEPLPGASSWAFPPSSPPR